ncbi:hypothetical protein BJ875DRAFT_517592 [Amylocarpus encephaloides]|uniref:Glycosyl hydrolase family 13 catalytic domain-containing protein n=1 Tax=Amylocarpus encephaloides TaxID=45428 RepID=A0A9P7YDT3_9HELO|nr:hypothetical protein BJ875DRAFT_517592 [Amylocarpus encephaloides]
MQASIYPIDPASFTGSNNDGTGDILGIVSRLGHLKKAGMAFTLNSWQSGTCPISTSPQVDVGYDVSDSRDIHETYGTVAMLKSWSRRPTRGEGRGDECQTGQPPKSSLGMWMLTDMVVLVGIGGWPYS